MGSHEPARTYPATVPDVHNTPCHITIDPGEATFLHFANFATYSHQSFKGLEVAQGLALMGGYVAESTVLARTLSAHGGGVPGASVPRVEWALPPGALGGCPTFLEPAEHEW